MNTELKYKYAFIDLFCGCGGSSTGIEDIPEAAKAIVQASIDKNGPILLTNVA